MRYDYDNALKMMLQGDEDLAKLIQTFIAEFPERLTSKIEARKKHGIVIEGKKRWVYEETPASFNISVGKAADTCKDYMSLHLKSVTQEKLKNWPKYVGEELIGYFTIYLYDKEKPKKTPMRTSYDFLCKRVEKDIFMRITTNVTRVVKEEAELLEKYGLNEIQEGIINNNYKIDIEKVLSKGDKR